MPAGAPTLLGDLARRAPRLMRRMTALHGALVLSTRGRLLASWFGAPILVLETRGRHTNALRATPLVYLPHGDGFAVVPANAGAERTPAWWLNLQAAGNGVVVLGGRRQPITAALASGEERARLWRRMSAIAPVDHYQRRTSRTLPVVVLSRAGAAIPARERPARLRPALPQSVSNTLVARRSSIAL
jgi:deazaflavin-dependent oxidoreductase (nitroreductase family)